MVEFDEFVQRFVEVLPEPTPEPIKINPSEYVPLWRKPKEKKDGN